jgi:hexosaminidase
MKITRFFCAVLAAFSLSALMLSSCTPETPTDLTNEVLIPKPVSVTATGKRFRLTPETSIRVNGDNAELNRLAGYLAGELKQATGLQLTTGGDGKNSIELTVGANNATLGAEGYELTINKDKITISANESAGVFYGIQTLLQLTPLKSADAGNPTFDIATGTISDYPRYSWRGSMLDVARHFFGVDDVKRYIDRIAAYKMNILHLHLSDDQGWRIEIKSWPNLAIHGGATQVGGGKGGYYTQEQYKEIQQYAADRFITIIPEIDMPSHINAALAAYGELNGKIVTPEDGRFTGTLETKGIGDAKNKPTDLYTGIRVGWSTLVFDKPATWRFVNDVLRELSEITTGPYIHIGGDEALVTPKEEYIAFVNRFSEIVKANGKKMIGWEEIAQANIDDNAIAQYWHSAEFSTTAAQKGASIIFSPSTRIYLDMQYDSTSRIGLHWAAYVEVDDSYNWDPANLVPGIAAEKILGVEAPLWTETVESMNDIDYLVFPRLPGVAEIAWSPATGRDWEEYKLRLAAHGSRMTAKGIDFYRSPRVPWTE